MAAMSSALPSYPRILVDYSLSCEHDATLPTAMAIDFNYLRPEEEIAQVYMLKYI